MSMSPGPCAKVRVQCFIFTKKDGTFVGENWCRTPQKECPRKPGEDYAKCKSVCNQDGHAEIEALRKARAADADLTGAIASVLGHTYVCQHCQGAMREAGVRITAVNNYRDMTNVELKT